MFAIVVAHFASALARFTLAFALVRFIFSLARGSELPAIPVARFAIALHSLPLA